MRSTEPYGRDSKQRNEYGPVIIIGAPRSGTNMLRDMLVKLPGFGTWPCDEINYIWRYSNSHYPHDEFPPSLATGKVKTYISNAFRRIADKQQAEFVVEKTCANSLRVNFVDSIVPDAKYIFIYRDGRDVVASEMIRWKAPLDYKYVLKKARYIPLTDVPYYCLRYCWHRLYRLFSNEKRLGSWGPRFNGIDEVLKTTSLAEVCCEQWIRCVKKAAADLDEIPGDRVHRICYETFVTQPSHELSRLIEFLDPDHKPSDDEIQSMVTDVTASNIGKWRKTLDKQTIDLIVPILQPTLKEFGYV